MGAMRIMAAGILSPDHEVGDVTIGWTQEQDAAMADLIQRKMDQGVRFFIVQPFGDERSQIQRIQDIRGREVVIGDEDIQRMFSEGRVGFFGRIRAGVEIIRRTLDSREAARSHTWAMRQFQGG